MPIAVHVKYDERTLKEAQHILRAIPRAMPRVMRRAINRTVDTAATDLKRRVGEQVTAKKSAIAKGIGKRKASNSSWTGHLSALYYRPGLIEFPGTRQTKRGVTYRIDRSARKLIAGGFISSLSSGHRGVFKREGLSRLPIYEAAGPSIWHVATDTPGLLSAVQTKASGQLVKHIDDQIGVELRRWEKR